MSDSLFSNTQNLSEGLDDDLGEVDWVDINAHDVDSIRESLLFQDDVSLPVEVVSISVDAVLGQDLNEDLTCRILTMATGNIGDDDFIEVDVLFTATFGTVEAVGGEWRLDWKTIDSINGLKREGVCDISYSVFEMGIDIACKLLPQALEFLQEFTVNLTFFFLGTMFLLFLLFTLVVSLVLLAVSALLVFTHV